MTPSHRLVAALAAVALVAAGCGRDSEAKDGISLSIVSPENGTTIAGNVALVHVDVQGVTLVKPDGDTSGKTGHLHAFVDMRPVAVGEMITGGDGIIHSDNPIFIPGLAKGAHTITVVLGDGKHRRLGEAQATTKVTVAGPTVSATSPPVVREGEPVRLEFHAHGIQIVKADGDASGATAHFHVFVDRDLPASGQPIDKPADGSIIHTAEPFVDIPNQASGTHTLLVVLGNGAHVPLAPMVADRVVVTVQ